MLARPGCSPGGPFRERRGGTPGMHEYGKSDSPVVPARPPTRPRLRRRRRKGDLAEGNTDGPTRAGLRAGSGVPSGLDRLREVARRDKGARFTAALHHVSLERLVMAYWALSPKAAPGVDGVTWQDYGQDLVANLRDPHDRVHSGRYRARPSQRAYIPKVDGRLRRLGITALEDKIVQRAVVEVLNAIRARVIDLWYTGRRMISAGTSRRCFTRTGSRCGFLMCCRAMFMTWPPPARMSSRCCGRSWMRCRPWPIRVRRSRSRRPRPGQEAGRREGTGY